MSGQHLPLPDDAFNDDDTGLSGDERGDDYVSLSGVTPLTDLPRGPDPDLDAFLNAPASAYD